MRSRDDYLVKDIKEKGGEELNYQKACIYLQQVLLLLLLLLLLLVVAAAAAR